MLCQSVTPDYNYRMNYRRFKYEGWLYALAFSAALALRFIQLGALPLSDAEAEAALQAFRVAEGLKPALGAHPFYVLSASVLFFAYGGATNFLARVVPALAGSLIVFAPLLFVDERIKPRTGVILAFFLALDAGLVALSRQAASPMLAVTFAIFALGFYNKNRMRSAGVCAALLLLSGPAAWLGILGLGIAWALVRVFDRNVLKTPPASFTFSFLSTFILAGSLFFVAPNGLSAALASLPEFISRWTHSSSLPPLRMLIALLTYQPLGILLALIAMARGWWVGSKRVIPLSVWFLVALLLAVLIPAREMGDLAWALLPLWILSAIELTRYVDVYPEERVEVGSVAALTVFIYAFTWLNLSGMSWAGDAAQYSLRFGMLLGAALLLVLCLLLIAAGWSTRVAQLGGVWGLALAFGTLSLGGALGSAGLRGLAYPELWHPENLPAQANLLADTVNNMSEWGMGNDLIAPVTIVGVHSPALEWLLRDREVSVSQTVDIVSAPALVITPLQNDLALASSYRGQDFTWRQNPAWEATQPRDWLRWLALREMPQSGEIIILWARDDLFIDSSSIPPVTNAEN